MFDHTDIGHGFARRGAWFSGITGALTLALPGLGGTLVRKGQYWPPPRQAHAEEWLLGDRLVAEDSVGRGWLGKDATVRPATGEEVAAVEAFLRPTRVPFAAFAAAAARCEAGHPLPSDLRWVPTTSEFDRPARVLSVGESLAGWAQRARRGLAREIQLAGAREALRANPHLFGAWYTFHHRAFRAEELAAVYIPDAGERAMHPAYCMEAEPPDAPDVSPAEQAGDAYTDRLAAIRAAIRAAADAYLVRADGYRLAP